MKLKRGDTLAFYVNFKDSDGDPVARTGLLCQIRTRAGVLVDTMTIASTATLGKYLFTASVSTSTYPLTRLEADIQITDGATVVSSDTFFIEMIQDVTRAE